MVALSLLLVVCGCHDNIEDEKNVATMETERIYENLREEKEKSFMMLMNLVEKSERTVTRSGEVDPIDIGLIDRLNLPLSDNTIFYLEHYAENYMFEDPELFVDAMLYAISMDTTLSDDDKILLADILGSCLYVTVSFEEKHGINLNASSEIVVKQCKDNFRMAACIVMSKFIVVGFPSLYSSPFHLCGAVYDAWTGIDNALSDYNECIKNS